MFISSDAGDNDNTLLKTLQRFDAPCTRSDSGKMPPRCGRVFLRGTSVLYTVNNPLEQNAEPQIEDQVRLRANDRTHNLRVSFTHAQNETLGDRLHEVNDTLNRLVAVGGQW